MCNYKVGDRVQKTDGSTTVYIVTAVHPGRNGSSCTYDIQPDGGGDTQYGVPDGGLKPADD